MASDKDEAAFAQTVALWMRIQVEVIHNPTYKDHEGCKKTAKDEYENAWKPFQEKWLSGDKDSAALTFNHITRANGIAQQCIPGFTEVEKVRGVSIDENNPFSNWVDVNAPGGGHEMGHKPLVKPATAILAVGAGAMLVVTGFAFRAWVWSLGRAPGKR